MTSEEMEKIRREAEAKKQLQANAKNLSPTETSRLANAIQLLISEGYSSLEIGSFLFSLSITILAKSGVSLDNVVSNFEIMLSRHFPDFKKESEKDDSNG